MGGHKALGKSEVRRSASALMRSVFMAALACSISSPLLAAAALPMQPIGGYSLKFMKTQFLEGCAEIISELIAQGNITSAMTEAEKAKVLYEWVILNIASDDQALDISRTGYGAITNKKAVCQGYTALYNTLCKLAGIQVEGIVGTAGTNKIDHSWTLATLDGEKFYIDVTYGALLSEKEGRCDLRYFKVSEEILKNDHYWH